MFLSPWKICNEFVRWLSSPFVFIAYNIFYDITPGKGWRLYGYPIIQKHHNSIMVFGDNLQLRSTVSSNPLGANHPVILCTWQAGAVLEIGNDFGMTGGTICAAERITIGNRVTVGANTMIIDTEKTPNSSGVSRRAMNSDAVNWINIRA